MGLSIAIIGPRDVKLDALVRASGFVSTQTQAADLAQLVTPGSSQPDVVIMDLRGQSTVPATLARLKRQHPSTGVVIVASTLDPTLMLEAMRAGVNECVTEPLSQADLAAAITRVTGATVSAQAGPVFAFVGAKGGVGTTTTAVNVASALAGLGQAPGVMLVDLHIAYGDAAVYLGAEPKYSVLDALQNLHRMDEGLMRSLAAKTPAGVDLLASSDRTGVGPVEAAHITSLIDFVSHRYAFTVLDVPRAHAAALDALDRASTIVVVANQELATVRNAGRMATALRTRYGKTRVMTVINRTDRRAEIGQEDIERAVGGTIACQMPSDYRRALNAMHQGRPLAMDNHNELSASFKALARELAGVAPERPAPRGGGFMARLSGRRSS